MECYSCAQHDMTTMANQAPLSKPTTCNPGPTNNKTGKHRIYTFFYYRETYSEP